MANHSFETSATIGAPPERVWEILTDAAGYPTWDSGVRAEGRLLPGETVKLHAEVNSSRAFAVKVTRFQPPSRMQLSGGMPLGLFRGVRDYHLTPADNGTTEFRMREVYSGPLTPLIWRSIPDLGPSFIRFAQGLKARAESS
ncbi:MAG: SRPBCC family protein [Candidatus Limnocylindria bacterium]